MSLVGRLKRTAPSSLSSPSEWLKTALGLDPTYSGEVVTVSGVMGLAPFYRGVQLLAGSVGMLPCKTYQAKRQEAPRTARVSQLLQGLTNEPLRLAADEWWSIVQAHIDTWGNHYSFKESIGKNLVANLWPIDPSRVKGGFKNGRRVYVIDGDYANPHGADTILHFRGLSLDGVVGYSPIQLHRQTLGSEIARKKFGGKFWANDASPGVTLIHPNKLSPEAIDRIKAKWDDQHRGEHNRRKTAVLAEGMEVKQFSMPLEDAQFVEQARMSATDQALILGIPPYMVAGDSGGSSLTYSTVEGQSVDFLKWSLQPRLTRLQNTVSNDPDLMPESWYAKFKTAALLATTTKERYEAYGAADWMTLDEIREKEEMEPLPDGAGKVLSAKALKTVSINGNGGD